MAEDKKNSLLTTVLIVLTVVLLAVGFALFSVGFSIAYAIRSTIWTNMSTGIFWATTFISSLLLFGLIYRYFARAEESTIFSRGRPAVKAGLSYLVLNGLYFVLELILFLMYGGNWFRNIFLTAFPFLQGSPLLE